MEWAKQGVMCRPTFETDFRRLAAEYRALRGPGRDYLVKLGKLATQGARLKSGWDASFEPTSLTAKRKARSGLRHRQGLRAIRRTELTETALIANTLAVTQCCVVKMEELYKVSRSQRER